MLYCLGNNCKNKTSSVHVQHRYNHRRANHRVDVRKTHCWIHRCEIWEYGGPTVCCSWCSFDVNYLSLFSKCSFTFHGLSSGNCSKVIQLHEISPILLFNLLFVYSSITVFISIDLVFHTSKNTHPHFSQ